MTHSVDVEVQSGVRIPLARERVAAIARATLRAEGVRAALLSVAFVSRPAIARLNARYLRRRGATDVIAFALTRAPGDGAVLGDIYIAPEVARANAKALGVGVREELARLVIHGVLHVLGRDHPEHGPREGSPMWRRQEAILRRIVG